MAAVNTNINVVTPKAKEIYHKFLQIVRTDTTAFVGVCLPKDAAVVGAYVIGSAASNAGTTATIDVGTTATANELIASYDVKTAGTGEGYNIVAGAAVGSAFASKLTADTCIYAKYTESGAASSSGGPWTVKLEYVVLGPGESVLS